MNKRLGNSGKLEKNRGRPQLSTFSLMIIPIVTGGWGLKNVDNYHNFYLSKGRGVFM